MTALYACQAAEKRGIHLVTLMVASAYTMHGFWQYGLSSGEGLLMATPGYFLEKLTGVWPINTTLFSLPAITMTVLWIIVCTGAFIVFHSRLKKVTPISAYPEILNRIKAVETLADGVRKQNCHSARGLRTIARFSRAVMQSVVAAWAVIIVYPIYAGIASIISGTPIGFR